MTGFGLKSASAIVVAGLLVAIAAVRGALAPEHLAHLGAPACWTIGLVAALGTALVMQGWHPAVASRTAIALHAHRLAIIEGVVPRELPAFAQRALLFIGIACVAVSALGNHAAAKLAALPGELASPSPSRYCLPKVAAAPAAKAAPAPVPIEQPGCALVKRAFQLGYAKTLGSCAPKVAVATPDAPVATKPEVCERRQLDEPFLHFAARRLAGAFGDAVAESPIARIEHRAADVRTHIDYLGGLVADIHSAIEGSPHAAHHIWINLPDPHPTKLIEHFTGEPRCSTRFASLPLWPSWHAGDESRVVEHVLGQLLFATRFGTTASCNDYTIHWDAPADACAKLRAAPTTFATASVGAVLDRRKRQLELGELAKRLGRTPPLAPPPADAIVSFACLSVGAAKPATGTTVQIDGETISVREVGIAAVKPTGDGPIDVYLALAAMLGGTAVLPAPRGAAPTPAELDGDDFSLTRLDALTFADPFYGTAPPSGGADGAGQARTVEGTRWPLDRPDLVPVFPFEPHLHAFIETFRRGYLAQRGRL